MIDFMKRIIILAITLLSTVIVFSCRQDEDYVGTETFFVASERGFGQLYEGEGYYYYVRYYSEEDEWTKFYDTITGFDYREGYEYNITVDKYRNDPDLADAGKYRYELRKINSCEQKMSKMSAGCYR